MAFSYTPAATSGAPAMGLQYGGALQSRQTFGDQQPLDYSNQFPAQQQQQQSIDPMQAYKMYQQFAGQGASSSGSGSGLSGLLSSGSGSAGLGGSGLIGSAGGATSAASTGGASYGLGGSLVGGTGAVGGSTFASGAGAGAAAGGTAAGAGGAAGGAAAGGGSAAGGAMAAAGPWAALAAIIMINEEDSRKKGLRAENRSERTRDQLTGKVLTQDIEGKWGPMFDKWTGGNFSKLGFQGDAKGASQIASLRIGPGLKTLWNEGTIKKIRDIF